MDQNLPLSVWPEWEIVEKLGEGSYGKVYKAERFEHGSTFYSAIKIITIPQNAAEIASVRSENMDEDSVQEYFRGVVEEYVREIQTMESLKGISNVVSVEDYKVLKHKDKIGWDIHIRMEYLTSFLEFSTGRQLSEEEVIQLGIDLASALDYCQKRNIIHRDVKPENIFVSSFGEFKLGDFGIARKLEKTAGALSRKGTFTYMAPEMYHGDWYDQRADQYSLGIVLYKLMNKNRGPFLDTEKQGLTYRDKEVALAKRMAGEPMQRPAMASREFGRIILKACEYQPEQRFETAAEMREALENLQRRLAGAERERRKIPEASYQERSRQREEALPRERTKKYQEPELAEDTEEFFPKEEASFQKKLLPWVITIGAMAAVALIAFMAVKIGTRDQKKEPDKAVEKPIETPAPTPTEEEPAVPMIPEPSKTPASPTPSPAAAVTPKPSATPTPAMSEEDRIQQELHEKEQEEQFQSIQPGQVQEVTPGQTEAPAPTETPEKEEEDVHSTEVTPDIQTIKDQYNTILGNQSKYQVEGIDGERLRYYDGTSTVKTEVFPSVSAEGMHEEYYFWNGSLFYVYIWGEDGTQNQYYYKDGKLIRWIDSAGGYHNSEYTDPNYSANEEKYWNRGIWEYQES